MRGTNFDILKAEKAFQELAMPAAEYVLNMVSKELGIDKKHLVLSGGAVRDLYWKAVVDVNHQSPKDWDIYIKANPYLDDAVRELITTPLKRRFPWRELARTTDANGDKYSPNMNDTWAPIVSLEMHGLSVDLMVMPSHYAKPVMDVQVNTGVVFWEVDRYIYDISALHVAANIEKLYLDENNNSIEHDDKTREKVIGRVSRFSKLLGLEVPETVLRKLYPDRFIDDLGASYNPEAKFYGLRGFNIVATQTSFNTQLSGPHGVPWQGTEEVASCTSNGVFTDEHPHAQRQILQCRQHLANQQCGCGVNAFKGAMDHDYNNHPVWAIVKLEGIVRVMENGYRAERGTIVDMVLVAENLDVSPNRLGVRNSPTVNPYVTFAKYEHTMRDITRTYRAPIKLAENKATALQYCLSQLNTLRGITLKRPNQK